VRYPAEQTAARHERILREASKLFRQRGLNGVSVPQIMKAARLTHGPFYNHFESKEALVAESIDRAMADTLQYIASFTRPTTARRQFLDAYLSPQHRDNPGEGCPIAALAGDVVHNPPAKAPSPSASRKSCPQSLPDSLRAARAIPGGRRSGCWPGSSVR